MTDSLHLSPRPVPTVRLTVVGAAGRLDLAVSPGADASAVLGEYGEALGVPVAGLELRTAGGAALDPRRPVAALGVEHGALLVVCSAPGAGALDPDAPATGEARCAAPSWAAAVAGFAAVAAGVLAAMVGDPWRAATAGLLAVAVPAVLLAPTRRATGAAPALGLGVGVALGYASGPGGLLLGGLAGSLGALAAAGLARAVRPDGDDEPLLAWAVSSALVALAALAALLAGVGTTAVLPVLFTAAVVAALLLPAAVVDVPDTALVDLDLLAVTAWSARERPRSRRRRVVVRGAAVAALVERGRRLVEAGSVAVALVAAASGAVLVLAGAQDLTGDAARVLVLLGAGVLALATRGLRIGRARTVLRLTALWCFALLGLHAVTRVGPSYWWVTAVVAAGLGLVLVAVALAMGRGWRSVRWARAGEVAQTLCVVLLVGALPVACGLFVWIRGFTS